MLPALRQDDLELTRSNITELENSDQVTRFFAQLGYDVDVAATLSHESLGLDAEDVKLRIGAIKKIAADRDGEIEVILFEVRSVTVDLIQAITRRFRQRAGQYLLVLTKDYEALDFVLLDSLLIQRSGNGSPLNRVIHPRILTVNRHEPGAIALRVLKRFTVTEADSDNQWDKLRSAYSLAEWTEPDFNNRALFSDYYLKHRLTDKTITPAWGDDVRRLGSEAVRLIAGARERLTGKDMGATRAALIEPLFKLLGFGFTAHIRKLGAPDYTLYAPDKADKPLVEVIAYQWNRNLDSTDSVRDAETPNDNPAALVVTLLEKAATPWVILTNGKFWRLYSATASNKITHYVDFYCAASRLVVEVDGPIHETQRKADQERQALIESLGITVIRFTNDQVMKHIDDTLTMIRTVLKLSQAPSDSPSLLVGEGAGGWGASSQSPELFWTQDDIRQLADDCLNVRVLDPAMGSGHFLVEVVDYISNRLIDFLNGWSENPVWALLEQTRTDILSEMERQGISIDESKLTRVVLLKRSVLKRCVYGVDLNAMAVELAKVSLWLDAFTLGAPLSFLDHHLKHGNSLIGARLNDVYKGQLPLWAQRLIQRIERVRSGMEQIGDLPDATIAQTRASKNLYDDVYKDADPLRRLLNVHTSRWFGNGQLSGKGKSKTDHATLFLHDDRIEAWLDNPVPAALPTDELLPWQAIAETALKAAEEKHFFHWELEFPEVFFAPSKAGAQDVQLRKDAGFNAVVGNPPYVRQEANMHKTYFAETFETYSGRADMYVYFLEQETMLTVKNGGVGVIVSNKFSEVEYGTKLQQYLIKNAPPVTVLNFGDLPVFEDATAYPMVMMLRKGSSSQTVDYANIESLEQKLDQCPKISVELAKFNWKLPQSITPNRFVDCVKLQEYVGSPLVGLKTGLNEAFLVTSSFEDLETEDTLQCYVFGRNIGHYSLDADPPKVVFPYSWDGKKYIPIELSAKPATSKKLNANIDKLKQRAIIRDKYPKGQTKWYEYQQINASLDYSQPKIVFPNVAIRPSFALDEGYLIDMTGFIIPSSDRYLLAILNSSLSFYFIAQSAVQRRGGYFEWKAQYVENLPIHCINFTTPAARRAQLVEDGHKLYTRSLSEGFAPLLNFTAQRLAANETDVIHDLLAFLAQQMIDLNKRKQAEVKRFLGWLETTLHIAPKADGSTGIDSLTAKTIIAGYLGDYQKGEPETAFEDFYFRLHQNRGRFGASLTEIKPTLADEYEKSLAALLPIKAQLAATDALIDRVVYQLYGLTDEEIRLIEYPGLEQAISTAREETLKEKDVAPGSDAAIEKIAEKVGSAAEQYLARVTEADVVARLRSEITGWDALPDKVRLFLVTGELALERNNLPEYSGVVISFAKAAEVLLNERLFLPFREGGYTPHDCNNEFFQKFMAGGKSLTLGSMVFILPSNHEKTFRTFVQGRYPNADATIFAKDKLLKLLDQAQVEARNGAAHDGVLTQADAQSVRQWAVEIVGYV